jgi:beta-phosphoglucomutase-like phosphatase (HAD superfamily)
MQYNIKPDVKGLIFDLDGTLVDSMPMHLEGWKKACERFGATIDSTFLRQHTGIPGEDIAQAIIDKCGLNGNVTVEQIIKIKHENFFNNTHLIKAIEPVASIVRKYYNNIPIALGTGGHREAVESTLEVTNLKRYFSIIVTSDDVERHKPFPDTFLKCAALMKIDPEFIEVFEDGDLGIEAAKRAGMKVTDVRSWYHSAW